MTQQSDAEPVSILQNTEGGFKEVVTHDTAAIYDNNPQPRLVEEIFDFDRKLIGFRVYDAPPRPDVSAEIEELQRENKVLRAITRGAQKADASAELMEAALEQALDCIRGETPEDMSHEEARQDTIDKIREALRSHAANRSTK